MPANVELVTDNGGTPGVAQAAVEWDITTLTPAFNAGATAEQIITVTGTVAAFPNTVAPGSMVLPATVTATITVAAP